MLLGIGLHAALSFMPLFWPVQDSRQSDFFGVIVAAIHGFRMPVFFVMSGFFTAMLWRRRGLRSVLWHRFRRIFLPLLLGLITVVPAVDWVVLRAVESGSRQAFQAQFPESADVNEQDPESGLRPLSIAVISDETETLELLLPMSVAALLFRRAQGIAVVGGLVRMSTGGRRSS
jgi:hypothetical protein